MRRFVLVFLFAVGCAASTNASDAGADLSVSKCDPGTLFSSCTQQCSFHVCGIGNATCDGGQWMCDCTQAVICGEPDGGGHD